jgi:hypothetical protein
LDKDEQCVLKAGFFLSSYQKKELVLADKLRSFRHSYKVGKAEIPNSFNPHRDLIREAKFAKT